MSTEEEVLTLPAKIVERSAVVLAPVMDLNTARQRLDEFQSFVNYYLSESQDGGQDGGDYGIIPGTKKKTLLKSGADKLCELYGLYDEYQVISTVEDWDRGLFDYTLKCVLKSRRDDSMVGTGVGSCSSFESKYRWRESQRVCPTCQSTAIIKGKADFGGGWLCWNKKGGCGAKFKDGDASIEKQIIGRVENPDIIDSKNTVLKIAKKRAKIDAVIGVTRSSGIFAQDLDEIIPPNMPPQKPEPVTEEPVTFTKNKAVGPVANSASGDAGPASPQTAAPSAVAPVGSAGETKGPPAQAAEPEYISLEDAQALHFNFRDFLSSKLKKKADAYLEEWCRAKGYKDAGGAGTTKMIKRVYMREGKPEDGYLLARQALENHALDLNAKLTESK